MKEYRRSSISSIKRHSVSRKLIFYLILFSSLITLIGSGFQVHTEYSRDIKAIEKTYRDIETSHLPNIINSLWVSDYPFLKTQLSGIVGLPDMQYLEISLDNRILISEGTFQPSNSIKKEYPLQFEFRNKTINLGTLYAYASLDNVYNRILDRLLVILATQAVIIVLITTCTIFLFYFLVGRHLISMSNYTRSLSFNELEKPLVLKRRFGDQTLDELRQLELSINEMRENLTSDKMKQERIERQLRESEAKNKILLDNIPQKIFFKDSNSVYITCNKAMADVLGIKKETIIGKTDFDLFPHDLAEKYRSDDHDVYVQGVAREIEEPFSIGNQEFIVQTVKSPIFDSEHHLIGLLGIFWDITEKKKAERDLMHAKNELEKRVKERTGRLQEINNRLEEEIAIHKQTEEKLVFAKQVAEQANQAKSEFLSNISHELRTPMHHILNYSRFGLEKIDLVPREKLIHYFSQIRKTGNRLMVLLNDLLDLSKLESGKAVYSLKPHNILHIMEEAIAEVGFLAREKKVFVQSDTNRAEIYLICDSYKIGQVFRNLLINAIKYSPNQGIVTVSLEEPNRKSLPNSKGLQVTISDNGVGIPEDEFDAIFDKFTQSSHTKTGAGGSGLGLAICKEIIEGHGGRIWVNNNDSGGAAFHFTLPLPSKKKT